MIDVTKARTSIRLHNASPEIDEEISSVIEAAVLDMKRVGIDAGTDKDELVDCAIIAYLRWQFDYCGKASQYEKAYSDLRNALSMSSGYVAR